VSTGVTGSECLLPGDGVRVGLWGEAPACAQQGPEGAGLSHAHVAQTPSLGFAEREELEAKGSRVVADRIAT